LEISIVIIGRNSEELLRKNYLNREFHEFDFAKEIIFVDSDSTDNTCNVVVELGWKLVQLSNIGRLSAAAGRYVGTKHAKGDYILFMDSDMILKFNDGLNINDLIKIHFKDRVAGIGGMTCDVFPNGKNNFRLKRTSDGDVSDTFGGFILLKKDILIEVGNWNPNVIANEENELYARFIKHNYKVVLSRKFYNLHYTYTTTSLLKQLINAYIPISTKGRRLYGAPGMGLRSAFKYGSVNEYLYHFNSETVLTAIIFFLSICVFFF
jgi:glycosyltransferase involved in cell wall biosynthesis